ncbi:hypothetical protein [Streptomyces sp. NBC_00356]|uniref:hypothetical protein n=1 Tax=Streptomyces sp. NBC_00356 TaxID=2975724 RepID=UPI002E255F4B
MTDRLSPQHETEIRERAEAATPGPWVEYADYGKDFYAYTGGPYLRGVGTLNFGDGDDADADLEFTQNAREDVLAVAAELAAVRAERDEAQARVDEVERRYIFNIADLRREVDHHKAGKERWRKRAREAEAMVYELKRPAIEQERNEVRSSMTCLASEAESEGDHEGAALLALELDKYESKWRSQDEAMRARIGAETNEHHTVDGTRYLCHQGDHYCPNGSEGASS